MDLIATRSFKYGTRRLMPDEPFQAKDRDGRLLIAIKKARPGRKPGKIAAPSPEIAGKIAAKVSKTEDIAKLRADYQKKTGKRAFNGWNADTLREKIASA